MGDGVFVLAKRAKKNLPVYRAEFSYLIEPLPSAAARPARGDNFKLGHSGLRCTVAPEAVTLGIRRPDGKSERVTLRSYLLTSPKLKIERLLGKSSRCRRWRNFDFKIEEQCLSSEAEHDGLRF
ncbi:MAG: hypothetical protein ACI8XO_000111 [Verrucomicrobiales bacterium]